MARIHRTIPKNLNDLDNYDGVVIHLEPNILKCEVKWALGSITTNKASGGDGTPAEIFQFLKDNAIKVLHSIRQQIWKTQQWPQDLKMSVFIPIPQKAKPKNVQTTCLLWNLYANQELTELTWNNLMVRNRSGTTRPWCWERLEAGGEGDGYDRG